MSIKIIVKKKGKDMFRGFFVGQKRENLGNRGVL